MSNDWNDRTYKRLMESGNRGKVGTWHVTGEDPNCDLGGPHYEPSMGYYDGKFEDIVEMALRMPGFFSWGYGGDVKAIKVSKVDKTTIKQKAETRSRIAKLEAELKQLKEDLGE